MDSATISGLPAGKPADRGLRLHQDVCQALRAEAFAGLKALPKRGVEVGGVLIQRGAADAASVVDGFEFIPCQHLYGPSYRLSPADRENLRARCRELRAANAVNIIFFRSSTREAFQVTPEDVAVAQELPGAAAEIVLIQPFLTGKAIFRVFRPAKDRDWSEFEEFEVSEAPMAPVPVATVVASPARAEKPHTVPPTTNSAARMPAGNPPPRRSRFTSHRVTFLRTFGVLTLAVAAFFVVARGYWKGAPQATYAGSPDLGMQVVSQGDSLRLSWNRNLPSVRDSKGGDLEIRDGKENREISLDSTEVARAVIYYTPSSDDVTFRLNIKSSEPAQTSGIARILARRKAGSPLPVAEEPTAIPPALPAPGKKAGTAPPRAQPLNIVSHMDPPPSAPEKRPLVAASRVSSQPEAPIKPIIPPAEIPPPQPAGPEATGSSRLQAQSVPAAAVPPRADSSPLTAPTVDPKNPLRSATSNIAPTDLPVPPRAVTKVLPARRPIAPRLWSPVTVTVNVVINNQGKVVQAYAPGNPPAYWAGQAVEAARQWRFDPATLRGKRIPSVSTIEFRFDPQ